MEMLFEPVFSPWSLLFIIAVQILSKYVFQVNAKKKKTQKNQLLDYTKNIVTEVRNLETVQLP